MRLLRYGVLLESLKSEHLEMVRLWRNQEFVRCNMEFQDVLSRDDQKQWFSKLDPSNNLYWIIQYNDYPIGLIHIKNIDMEKGSGEAGVFVGEPSYLEMPQPMLAIIFMMELAFLILGLKELKAKIKSGNDHAIRFNEKLGYTLENNQPEGFQYYTVDRAQFEAKTEQLRASAKKMFGGKTGVRPSALDENLHRKLAVFAGDNESYFDHYLLKN